MILHPVTLANDANWHAIDVLLKDASIRRQPIATHRPVLPIQVNQRFGYIALAHVHALDIHGDESARERRASAANAYRVQLGVPKHVTSDGLLPLVQ
jgi:hypothetical protein